MELPWTVDWLNNWLPACRNLSSRPNILSVMSWVIVEMSAYFSRQCCWVYPWGIVIWVLVECGAWAVWGRCSRPEKSIWCCCCEAERCTRRISERWLAVSSVEPSEVGEPSCRTVVRISDVVEVGQFEYLSESVVAPDQACRNITLRPRSPGKGKRKISTTSASTVAPTRLFQYDDESDEFFKKRRVFFDGPKFEVALKNQDNTVTSRRGSRMCRAAPVFQSIPR